MVHHALQTSILTKLTAHKADKQGIKAIQWQLVILDGHQQKLRSLKWLTQLFREPYSYAHAQGNLDQSLQQHGFEQITTQAVGWINQLTVAFKPGLEV